MKNMLKRAGVFALAIVFVLSMNIKGTYGLEDNEAEASVQSATSVIQEAPAPETPAPETPAPAPETPAPETPAPETPAPETPAPETPAPETPAPETPAPETPAPETPAPETPAPETPAPETPAPETPETPAPETPAPETPAPETPETPAPETPAPETPAPEAPVVTEHPIVSAPAGSQGEAFSFKTSSIFMDNRAKSKYSVEVPIEGLPSFVTPEMIVAALKCQDETGYPASVTIAQIIQESGFGMYGPEGESGQGLSYLAYQYNNLFGIKGRGPAGSTTMATGEQTETGSTYMINAGFRVYNTYTESIEDRTKVLKEVYSDLTSGVKDANTFAVKIGGRWATDINYAKHLIQQMEKYDLYRLDTLTLEEFSDLLGEFVNPCPGGTLTSSFGYRTFRNSYHKGIDLGTGTANIPTYAAQAGTVVAAGWDDSTGNYIRIDHGNGLVTVYMHHDKLYVEAGEKVEKGQQIGLSGTTGDSTGNHLHFQLEKNGEAVDPMPYFQNLKVETNK